MERRRLQTGGSDYERGGRTPDRGRCGITAMSHGEDILLKAAAEQPHKIATLALLKPGPGEWRAQDWVAYFDARKQSTARRNGRSRTQAASLAFECCVVEWLNRHPAPSPPGRCAWCGDAESSSAVILPFGTEPGTHTWLHAECWPTWLQARRNCRR